MPLPISLTQASICPSRSARNATNFPSREIAAACAVPAKSARRMNLALARGLRQESTDSGREPGQRACDQHDRGRKYQHEPGWPGTPCSRARSSLGAWHDSDGSLNFTRAFLCESRAPTLPPGVELRAECKNGSLLIVPMAMNRHRFAPFPPLYGTDVALQI